MTTATPRTILHVDMDAFYVACELRRRPELRGLPVVVGGSSRRGVVAAASYEARRFGVRSATSSAAAHRLCPDAVFLPGDHAFYAQVSRQVHERFARVSPTVEPIALDEAFIDITGAGKLLGTPRQIADRLRAEIRDELDLPCSVGVAPVKFVAKLASEAAKPTVDARSVRPGAGVVVIEPGQVIGFLRPHPIRALWGVGPSTAAKLDRLGVATVADLADLPLDAVVGALGAGVGTHLHALANGIDDRDVVPDRLAKSIGHEETFADDRCRHDALATDVVRLADAVASRLRAAGLAGRTVQLKVRFSPTFTTITRSVTPRTPVSSGVDVAAAASELLATVDVSPGVRLLGIHAHNLVPATNADRQLSLDLSAGSDPAGTPAATPATAVERGWDDASAAIDEIRRRFGTGAIVPAALAAPAGAPSKTSKTRKSAHLPPTAQQPGTRRR
jgi:DNA polymerase IV